MIQILRTSGNKILRTAAGKLLYRAVNDVASVSYGLHYNRYSATDSRKITSSDEWVVPSKVQFEILLNYIDDYTYVDYPLMGWPIAGDKLKDTGNVYWGGGNTGTNEYGFNFRGSGLRYNVGVFDELTSMGYCYSSSMFDEDRPLFYVIDGSTSMVLIGTGDFNQGLSIRLLYTGSGTPTTYTGNDGKVYGVVVIGTQRWINANLAETRFRNGDIIPWYGANPANYFTNAEWAALTGPGCAAYGNVPSNVAAGFTFP